MLPAAVVCSSFLKILMDQKLLHVEAALLSRIIYRMKTKFRHDKGLKSMEKVNRCLLQYLRLNLASVYGNFSFCIKPSIEAGMTSEQTRMMVAPSRQMLEFLILRTLGFVKLLCKAAQYCEDAAIYLKDRMNLGHSWNYALVAISIISRIWCLTKYLVLSACEHYKNIVPFLDKLEYIGQLWNGFETRYPVDVDSWLNVWWITGKSQQNTKKRQLDAKSTYLDKIFRDISGEGDSVEIPGKVALNQFNNVNTDADLGEPVKRNAPKHQPIRNPKKSMDAKSERRCKKPEEKNPFGRVTSSKDLLKFLKREEKMRSENGNSAITKNMDKFQFNLLAKKIRKFIKKLNELEDQEGSNEFDVALKKFKKILCSYIQ
ncbi:nucleolus and neural progenitor protein isoform X2 [Hetaerina americana]|uniref:nucleolus and neural progenitor protein isoform X2 n=1 Tax=Hetaerina americana TaxID=62018 RepID=UPI003A7F2B11